MTMSSSRSAAPSAAKVLDARYTSRLPASLEKLARLQHGVVELPLHVAWPGLRAYELDPPRLRMGLYRTILAEGQHEDLVTLRNRDLPLAQWPVPRTPVSRHVQQVQEEAFPDLAGAGSVAA
ncbi:hypothetical protein ACFY0G_43260 [Streptomyces sp. NPDC001552]|uniref:hypothetical protein n=1 Tax=Streptomyces sp. NPDC001552 TaxID=3364587 RepID=UPI00369658ED